MNSEIQQKLEKLKDRVEELNALLADPAIISANQTFRELSIELSDIQPVVTQYARYRALSDEADEAQAMLTDNDPSIRKLAQAELPRLKSKLTKEEQRLQTLLLPKAPNDGRNVYLEIRAGTGGDEAALFAGNLFRMYNAFAEKQRWKVEVTSQHVGERGGFEAQGRIHTSACTVAVLPEAEEIDEFELDTSDLRIDTYRASGAGGQHVNRTDSAVRITHLPSGIVVECQDERSQHKNKARAMSVLRSRLLEAAIRQQKCEVDETRRSLVGSGDRSERIRTYNFPQGRVTDHRIGLTLYKLDEILTGNLTQVGDPLVIEHQAEELAAFSLA